jgi:hypothetical protein
MKRLSKSPLILKNIGCYKKDEGPETGAFVMYH